MHYRLRVIRGDPSGVVNFASHPKQNSCFHFLSHSFVLMKPFWNFFEILDKSCPLSFPDFFAQIWVIATLKIQVLGIWDLKQVKNKLLLLDFSTLLNSQKGHLNL